MKTLRKVVRLRRLTPHHVFGQSSLAILLCCNSVSCFAGGPMAAHVKVTTLQSYSGNPLPKPNKILVYDLVADPSQVQVDASQKIRPRHLATGDENPEAILHKTQTAFSEEMQKKLAQCGLPVERVAADIAPSANSLVVQGTFLTLQEGTKTERVVVGMGTGSAAVQTKVDVRLKTVPDVVLLSEFQTETTKAENMGGAVPVAAGMSPAAVGAKSVVSDRKKTLNAYAVQTADVSAAEILKAMAGQGWVKLNDKGDVIP